MHLAAEHRLVLPAVATWGGAIVLVGTPAAAFGVAVAALLLSLLCIALLLRRGRHTRRPRHLRRQQPRRRELWWAGATNWTGLLAVTFLGIALVASVLAIRDASRSPPLLTDAVESGRVVTVTIMVTDKTELQSRVLSNPWDRSTDAGDARAAEQRIRGTATELTVGRETATVSVPVVAFAEAAPDGLAAIGETLSLTGQLRLTAPGERAVAMVFAEKATTLAAPPPWLAWAPSLRHGLVERASGLPGRGGELLPGLAIGETTGVSDDLDSDMIASSLSHTI